MAATIGTLLRPEIMQSRQVVEERLIPSPSSSPGGRGKMLVPTTQHDTVHGRLSGQSLGKERGRKAFRASVPSPCEGEGQGEVVPTERGPRVLLVIILDGTPSLTPRDGGVDRLREVHEERFVPFLERVAGNRNHDRLTHLQWREGHRAGGQCIVV